MTTTFTKSFTQQEPIAEATIERVGQILRSGRLHRYNVAEGETAEAALLEREYAAWQGVPYCVACASGGYALQLALRAAGLRHGEKVLANAYTLAPVPGAIHAAGGVPVLVEIDDHWHVDCDDLEAKAKASGARFFMLSHMRGHICDMERVQRICDNHDIALIEDCAHTMGARWKGTRSGNFGRAAAFSTQTYKHINSGEGGLLTTFDAELAARAIVHSGSYMLYERHGAAPEGEVFDRIKLTSANMSGRMDNMRAALIRDQLRTLDGNIERWNRLYGALESALRVSNGITTVPRADHEEFVGSSLQFRPQLASEEDFPRLLAACAARGVELKWFGAATPTAFTSRYDSWAYLGEIDPLPQTLDVLASTCDIRVPLTFDTDDCALIGAIISQEVQRLLPAR